MGDNIMDWNKEIECTIITLAGIQTGLNAAQSPPPPPAYARGGLGEEGAEIVKGSSVIPADMIEKLINQAPTYINIYLDSDIISQRIISKPKENL